MKLLGMLWALHVISLALVFTFDPSLVVVTSSAFIIFGLAYLIQLGREAVKRKRRWIVWCLLGVIIPLWPALSFPIFYLTTRNDEYSSPSAT
jgi:hypothetical protein